MFRCRSEGPFDLVTSLSVIEHVDTASQTAPMCPTSSKSRLQKTLREMIRVTRPGRTYLSDFRLLRFYSCHCKMLGDAHYYYREGPAFSSAWPSKT